MTYFAESYAHFRYPLQTGETPGLRPAQLGAIHAAAAHFVTHSEPGIVTMPTGSGKTAVLISAAFVLRAQRVLIITPSRLVREQIAEEVASLSTLKQAGVVDKSISPPQVFSTKKRINDVSQWEAMRNYDVVVGTVPSISPEIQTVPPPPPDLFDLVLVDEAHHSPARTWQSVLNHFPKAKRLLFTATPFRQDQREIRGRFIFTYSLRQAYEDQIFGKITFQPVTPKQDENHDVAIAKAAELQFLADKEAGYHHHLMVRTDSRKRANELLAIYTDTTRLRLAVITGNLPLKKAKDIIGKLQTDELDGIVCVNMLGEGFNFPSLKIAAIHSPHRSLSVTLQFIGRFARTVGENIGTATFLAIPSEIEIETKRLYDSRAVWQEMIENLSAIRVSREETTRAVLESFSIHDLVAEDLSDLSLYVLEPYHHVKIYQLDDVIDITSPVAFPDALQVIYESVSERYNAAIYITREISLPRWTTDDRLAILQPDLFIFFQDVETHLLFICASRRAEGLYEQLVQSFKQANPRPLPLVRLNRALNDLETPEFFNVGMRNRVASNTTESYRMITGSNADKAILKSDGRLYHRGHVFGRASDQGDLVTIGLSSASKIWSNKSSKLPDLIAWCGKLAERIHSNRTPRTGSGLDFLDVGEEISELPPGIIGVDWPVTVFRATPTLRFQAQNGQFSAALLDFDLLLDQDASTPDMIVVCLGYGNLIEYRATFSFTTNRFFEPASPTEPSLFVEQDRMLIPIIDFINAVMPQFYTSDLSMIQGFSLLRPPATDHPPFDDTLIETIDWTTRRVDIRCEFGKSKRKNRITVHDCLENDLNVSDSVVVYYDHGSGEIADFVAFKSAGGRLLVQMYHCKGSKGAAPGHRLADVYEIAGQAVKSVRWALKQRILQSIRRRFTHNIGCHRFIKGDLVLLEQLLTDATPAQIDFEFVAVQPGLKKNDLPIELSNIFAAASDHLVRGGFKPLRVIGSNVST